MSSNLQHKLLNYEAEPPADAWDKLAAALQEATPAYPERLQQYQQPPAPHVWEQIEQQLHAPAIEPATKVIVLKPHRRFAQYAAAAVVLLIAAGIFYVSNNSSPTQPAQKVTSATVLSTIQAKARPAKVVATPGRQALNDTITLAATPPSALEKRKTEKLHLKKTLTLITAKKSEVVMPADHDPAPDLAVVPKEKNLINRSETDRYMVVTSEVGNAVRLPKKVYSSYTCSDEVVFASHQECKEKISSLQSKMSASLATDFAGFLDLLKNLQENSN